MKPEVVLEIKNTMSCHNPCTQTKLQQQNKNAGPQWPPEISLNSTVEWQETCTWERASIGS